MELVRTLVGGGELHNHGERREADEGAPADGERRPVRAGAADRVAARRGEGRVPDLRLRRAADRLPALTPANIEIPLQQRQMTSD